MVADARGQSTSGFSPARIRGLFQLQETSVALVAIVIALVFTAIKPDFLTSDKQVLINDTARYGLFAVGEAMLMITGEIDLSAAKIYSTVPFIAYYLQAAGVPFIVGLGVALIGGALIGALNGLITVRLGVPSLITTLGMLFVLNGITLAITQSQPVTTPVVEPINTFLGEGQQAPIGGPASYAGFIWLAVFVIILAVVLRRTRFGLHTISVGSNLLAAREIGIHTDRTKIINFMIMGLLAGFGGIIEAIQSTNIDPTAGNNNYTLYGIAAAVIGGTSLFGGSGTVIGSLIGAFVVSIIINGLPFVGAQANVSDLPLGLAIILAMIVNVRFFQRSRGRR